ncbi:MAG: hypothetical protein JWP63_2319 [Candidatus Solibacter sp.]|nr:hypothetical protein [Candidatus Solibacter sp.]
MAGSVRRADRVRALSAQSVVERAISLPVSRTSGKYPALQPQCQPVAGRILRRGSALDAAAQRARVDRRTLGAFPRAVSRAGARVGDRRHTDPRHTDPRHTDPRRTDPGRTDPGDESARLLPLPCVPHATGGPGRAIRTLACAALQGDLLRLDDRHGGDDRAYSAIAATTRNLHSIRGGDAPATAPHREP